jgi:hypothetical protein
MFHKVEIDQGLELVIKSHLQWSVPSGFKNVLLLESTGNRGKECLECSSFVALLEPLENFHVVTPVISDSYEKRPADFFLNVKKKMQPTH